MRNLRETISADEKTNKCLAIHIYILSSGRVNASHSDILCMRMALACLIILKLFEMSKCHRAVHKGQSLAVRYPCANAKNSITYVGIFRLTRIIDIARLVVLDRICDSRSVVHENTRTQMRYSKTICISRNDNRILYFLSANCMYV